MVCIYGILPLHGSQRVERFLKNERNQMMKWKKILNGGGGVGRQNYRSPFDKILVAKNYEWNNPNEKANKLSISFDRLIYLRIPCQF